MRAAQLVTRLDVLVHLGEKPLPPLEEIAADREFRPSAISKEDFEAVWARRSSPIRSTA